MGHLGYHSLLKLCQACKKGHLGKNNQVQILGHEVQCENVYARAFVWEPKVECTQRWVGDGGIGLLV